MISLHSLGDVRTAHLSGTVLGSGKDISARKGHGDRLFLDGTWTFETSGVDTHQ